MSNTATSYPVLVGFWQVDGTGVSNETPTKGRGVEEKARLRDDISKQFPNAKSIIPLGTKIEVRTQFSAFIEATPGMVIRNIFVSPDGKEDPVKRVGEVWFSGAPYDVVLIFSRAQGCVLVQLHPRITAVGTVRFTNQLNPQRLLTELPSLIESVLGGDARDLKLNIRQK